MKVFFIHHRGAGQRTICDVKVRSSPIMKRQYKYYKYNRKYVYASHYEIHSYQRVNNFKPGDSVYLIVTDHTCSNRKIIRTKIADVHQFNTKRLLTNNRSSEYWFDGNIYQTTGLPIQNVFRTYNEAKFYLSH